jgi:hypothetical protein
VRSRGWLRFQRRQHGLFDETADSHANRNTPVLGIPHEATASVIVCNSRRVSDSRDRAGHGVDGEFVVFHDAVQATSRAPSACPGTARINLRQSSELSVRLTIV